MDPVSLVISLGSAAAYSLFLKGWRAMRRGLMSLLPLMLLTALLNAAFQHAGATILLYLPSGNPLTLESVAYGWAAAALLGAVLTWFTCYNAVMTSDKFIYLFGRVIPASSLVLSMTLGFVPKLKRQLRAVREAQQCVGQDVSQGTPMQRVRRAVTVLSILVTWALENAIETADSMKSRGYGLPGRTAFSIYRWSRRDIAALIWLVFCGGYLLAGWLSGGLYWRYFPTFKHGTIGVFSVSIPLVYLAMCLTPLILDGWDSGT
jgi:energy-coupling factor transport system permease protein